MDTISLVSLGHTTDDAHDDQQYSQTGQQEIQTHNRRSSHLVFPG